MSVVTDENTAWAWLVRCERPRPWMAASGASRARPGSGPAGSVQGVQVGVGSCGRSAGFREHQHPLLAGHERVGLRPWPPSAAGSTTGGCHAGAGARRPVISGHVVRAQRVSNASSTLWDGGQEPDGRRVLRTGASWSDRAAFDQPDHGQFPSSSSMRPSPRRNRAHQIVRPVLAQSMVRLFHSSGGIRQAALHDAHWSKIWTTADRPSARWSDGASGRGLQPGQQMAKEGSSPLEGRQHGEAPGLLLRPR